MECDKLQSSVCASAKKLNVVGLNLQVEGEDLGVAATVPSLRQDQAWCQMTHWLMLQNLPHCRLCTEVG